MKKNKMFLAIFIATISGCGGGGGGDSGASTTYDPFALKALTISGVLHTISGSYDSGCLPMRTRFSSLGSHDLRYILSVTSTDYIDQLVVYSSNNGTCTGGILKTVKWDGIASTGVIAAAISGWDDINGIATTAPTANNGSSVGNSISYTPFTFQDRHFFVDNVSSTTDPDGVAVTLGNYNRYFIIDDTSGGPIRMWVTDCPLTGGTHCKAFPQNVDPLSKL